MRLWRTRTWWLIAPWVTQLEPRGAASQQREEKKKKGGKRHEEMGGNTLKQISCYGLACSLLMEYPGRHLEGECVRILSSHRDIHNDQSTRQNQCTSLADRHQLCGQLRSVEWPVVSSCRPRSLHPTPAATLAAVVSSCSKPHSRSKRL